MEKKKKGKAKEQAKEQEKEKKDDVGSSKLIDLMYLTNPNSLNKIKNIDSKDEYTKEELKSKKKMILKITEEIILGKRENISDDVLTSFFNYYNKILEDELLKKKVKIIQSQYEDIDKKKKKKQVVNLDVNDLDLNLLGNKEKKTKHMNLDSYVKKKNKKKKQKIHLPKKQNFK